MSTSRNGRGKDWRNRSCRLGGLGLRRTKTLLRRTKTLLIRYTLFFSVCSYSYRYFFVNLICMSTDYVLGPLLFQFGPFLFFWNLLFFIFHVVKITMKFNFQKFVILHDGWFSLFILFDLCGSFLTICCDRDLSDFFININIGVLQNTELTRCESYSNF